MGIESGEFKVAIHICKHYRTAIATVESYKCFRRAKILKIQEHLICLDCGEQVDFSPLIFVPDSFLISLNISESNTDNDTAKKMD